MTYVKWPRRCANTPRPGPQKGPSVIEASLARSAQESPELVECFRHEGEECVLVSHGELRITVAGDLYVLQEGDSLTYDSGLPHWYHNGTEHDAELIGAMTPPSF